MFSHHPQGRVVERSVSKELLNVVEWLIVVEGEGVLHLRIAFLLKLKCIMSCLLCLLSLHNEADEDIRIVINHLTEVSLSRILLVYCGLLLLW